MSTSASSCWEAGVAATCCPPSATASPAADRASESSPASLLLKVQADSPGSSASCNVTASFHVGG